ncbi:hypothetical protein EJ05DRAFT_501553 [Pseudovirgaria hyperparasitica]|uniref:Phytocyanin domain-containing protein n=1 Tax=Pseudovirgaria hyperparasitica TaxID=470096 RepID=A0A6A6W507_9PEZI|nr:uncharacterized protein EJ05DRAFT_501553 [Pseudovirgaria hyperparasitica]KAF2757010.1 hypothetical protein EJ05DRAFT_501553 [Pseudovirgaria hyperparasitica]
MATMYDTAAAPTPSAAALTPSAAAPTPSSVAGGETVHVVQVGGANGSLTFWPENTKANVGDLVQFQFNPKNHSVVQTTFATPCMPMQQVMPNVTNAFFSGFMPVSATNSTKDVLVYSVRVTTDKPIWYYCSQMKHCQAGMVGAINAPETGDKTVAAFKQLAAAAAENLSPGQLPSAGASPSSAPGAPNAGGAGSSVLPTGGAGAASTPTDSAGLPISTGGAAALDIAKSGVVVVAAVALAFLAL